MTTPTSFADPTDATPANFNSRWDEISDGTMDIINVKGNTYGAKGDGTTDDAVAIVAAAAAATALTNGAALSIPAGTYIIGSALTIAADTSLMFMPGAIFKPSDGVTLTINGPIIASLNQQIFSNCGGPEAGLGIVDLNQDSALEVSPQWFGAKQDSSTDDYNALMAAIYSGQVSLVRTNVQLLAASTVYMTSKGLELPKHTRINGAGTNNSTIRAISSFTGSNIFQNWRASEGTGDTAPSTTTGTGYPCPDVYLTNFTVDNNEQALNCFNLIHLQENTIFRNLQVVGNTSRAQGNANVGDGLRLSNNSDSGFTTQTFGIVDFIGAFQFRRFIDINISGGWIWLDRINVAACTLDAIRIQNAQQVSLNNLELLIADDWFDDTAGLAAISLNNVVGISGDNILIGANGSTGFSNRVGLLIDDDGGSPANRNYWFTNLRTTYAAAGTARFVADIRDSTITPDRDLTDQLYLYLTKGMTQGHTGSILGDLTNFSITQQQLGWKSYERTINDAVPTDVTFSAGDFTANSGTWTVAAGDVTEFNYSIVGKQMTVNFDIVTTTVSGGQAQLRITIPTGATADGVTVRVPGTDSDAGAAAEMSSVEVGAGLTYVRIFRGIFGSGGNWSAATDTTRVTGQITFWIA